MGVFFFYFTLLLHFLHKADEVVEAERAPSGGIEVVVGEGAIICHLVIGHLILFRTFVLGYTREIEGAAGLADGAVFLEVGELPYAGSELLAERLEPPSVFECLARGDGCSAENDGVLFAEVISGGH